MKKLTILFLIALPTLGWCQDEVYGNAKPKNKPKNSVEVAKKIDDFTKATIWETKWQKLYATMKAGGASIRGRRVNANKYLEIKFMTGGGVFSIPKGDAVYIKLANDSVLKLWLSETIISEKGAGATGYMGSNAWGAFLRLKLTSEQYEQLIKINSVKIRFYLRDGYVEEDIPEKNQDLISKSLTLLTE